MSANCKSCGRIMTKPDDFYGGDVENLYCSSCTNPDGSLKSLDEITLHIANQLIMSQGIDREAATKAARSILSVQPEWKSALSRQDNKRTRKQKMVLILTSVAITATTIFGGWFLFNVKWPEKELFKDIKPVISTLKPGDVEVTQVSFPGNQSSIVIDKYDSSINFSNGRYPYRFYLDKPTKGFSILPFGKAEFNPDNSFIYNFSTFIGSVKTKDSPGKRLEFFYGNNWENQNLFTSEIGKNDFLIDSKGHVSDIGTKIINKIGFFCRFIPIFYNIVFVGKYIAWIGEEPDSPNQYTGIVVLNTETNKTIKLDINSSNIGNIQSNDKAIFWEDYSNINQAGFELKGFDLDSMALLEIPITRAGSLNDNNHLVSGGESYGYDSRCIWKVVNDMIFVCDYDNYSNSKFCVYNYRTKQMVDYKVNTVLTISEKFKHKSPFGNTEYFLHYSLGGMPTVFNNDSLLWLAKDSNGNYSFSIGKAIKLDDAVIIPTNKGEGDYVDYVGTTNNWIVWKSRKLDRKSHQDDMHFVLYATNIATKETLAIGKCNENFYSSFDDISVENGIIAWSSITDNGDTDVFFAKLPEGK